MRNALLAGILASIACGIIGVYVVTKRIVFISGGLPMPLLEASVWAIFWE
jgi:ABC-type Mn2+/Zn2+ transport system permease subunit